MKNTWPQVKLGELLTHYTEYIEAPEPRIYPKLSVRLYGKGVVLDSPADGTSLKMKRHQIARAGQVILSEIWGKKGSIGFVPREGDGALCTSHFFLFDLTHDRLDPQYLRLIFTGNYLEEQLNAEAFGTTGYAAVRPKNLLGATIPLPPLPEQRRIVARIEELAAKVEEAHGLRAQSAEEAESFGIASVAQVFAQAGERLLFRDTNSCEIICGQHLSPDEQSDSGIPYTTGPADFGKRVAVPSRYARFARSIAKPGDVLLTVKGAGVGKVNLAPVMPAAIGRQLYALRPKPDKLDQFFLYYALQDGLQHFRESITATTVPGIGLSDVEALRIPFPALPEQRRIVAYLDGLQEKVDSLKKLQEETAKELNAFLPSILSKAFAGEL